MSCDEAQPYLGAAPASLPDHVAEHIRGCVACAARLRTAMRLERDLERAFALPVPALANGVASLAPALSPDLSPGSSTARSSGLSTGVRRRGGIAPRWALAASVALAALLGVFFWAGRPSGTLAAAIVTHVDGEPESWSATNELDRRGVERVLAAAGVRLDPGSTDVVYAHSCWFRGHFIPHLVVRTEHGPVTVLVLREEHVDSAEHFRREGFDGTLVPFGRGSLAVIGRSDQAVSPELLQRLQSALHPS